MICKICEKECKSSKSLLAHVKKLHNLNVQEYYDLCLKQPNDGFCLICSKPTSFVNIHMGYRNYCSSKCAANSTNTKEKRQNTCMSKYGCTNISQNEDIKKKKDETCLKHYGVKNPSQSETIKNNIKIHNKEKYGIDYIFQSEEFKNKAKQTCIQKYGEDNYTKTYEYKTKTKSIMSKRQSEIEQQGYITKNQLILEYGSGWYQAKIVPTILINHKEYIKLEDLDKIIDYCDKHKFSNKSHKEKIIVDYIRSIYNGTIIENSRQIISPQELDIYLPDKNLAIEFNGNYYHSTLHNNDKHYHENKSLICQEKGIRLIHIYEYELQEPYWSKIKLLLNEAIGISNKIYARNCEICEISNKEAKPLNESIHLQGHRNAQITYGLFYNNELVQLMSFSKTRYNRNLKNDNEWEIIRGCPGSNTTVVGGVSKLFKHFIKIHKPSKIFSYCDFNKFNGISYEKLGMSLIGYTGPDKTWLINNQPIKRNPKLYKQLKGNPIIWGSGSKKYEWSDK